MVKIKLFFKKHWKRVLACFFAFIVLSGFFATLFVSRETKKITASAADISPDISLSSFRGTWTMRSAPFVRHIRFVSRYPNFAESGTPYAYRIELSSDSFVVTDGVQYQLSYIMFMFSNYNATLITCESFVLGLFDEYPNDEQASIIYYDGTLEGSNPMPTSFHIGTASRVSNSAPFALMYSFMYDFAYAPDSSSVDYIDAFNTAYAYALTAGVESVPASTGGTYDEGYTDGYNDGKTAGYNDGKTAGYNEGHTAGYNEGHTAGYNEGDTAGYNRGYSNGESVGYQRGYTAGINDNKTAYDKGYNEGHTAGYNEGGTAGYNRGYTVGYREGSGGSNPDEVNPVAAFLAPVHTFMSTPFFGSFTYGMAFNIVLFVAVALIFLKIFAGG